MRWTGISSKRNYKTQSDISRAPSEIELSIKNKLLRYYKYFKNQEFRLELSERSIVFANQIKDTNFGRLWKQEYYDCSAF